MFSGIVETTSIIISLKQYNDILCCGIERPHNFDDLQIGNSIAVNGVCLTLTQLTDQHCYFDIVQETLLRSNLAELKKRQSVNLERALKANMRISGHYVQGHVDTTATVTHIEETDKSKKIFFSIPSDYQKHIVEKAFIAIDGMSLTICDVKQDSFAIAFIPHTLANTIAKHYQPGTEVNIETDIMGKYILNYMEQIHAK